MPASNIAIGLYLANGCSIGGDVKMLMLCLIFQRFMCHCFAVLAFGITQSHSH